MQNTRVLTFKYMLGLALCSYCGWVGGTILGTFASGLLPQIVISALGISLYAMFIAIIIPPARDSKAVLGVIIISVIISCIFAFVPNLKNVGNGWVIIIAGVLSAAIGARYFPMKSEENNDG